MPKVTTEEQEAELAKRIAQLEADPMANFHDDGTVTLELARPVRLKVAAGGEAELKELTFKNELTAGDLEDSEKDGAGEIGQANRLIAAACNTPYGTIRKLRTDDLEKAGTIVAKLSGKGQSAGGTA